MRLVITGDKSRYQFFREMVSSRASDNSKAFYTGKMGEKDICLTSDLGKTGDYVFYSEKIPLNTDLFFAKECMEWSSLYKMGDRVLIFDEFPYGTGNMISGLEQLLLSDASCRPEVILVQNNRVGLSSDISSEESAAEDAKTIYENYRVSVQCYHAGDRPDFLWWSKNLGNVGQSGYFRSLIHGIWDDLCIFESSYDLEYELSLRFIIENPKSLDEHFRYETRLKGKNVWEIYYGRAYRFYWENNPAVDEFMIRIYERGIAKLCVWDLTADISEMKQAARSLFEQQFGGFICLTYEGGEGEYTRFINRNLKEILAFKQKIVQFFAYELRQFLQTRIENDLKTLEELLNECDN